MTSRRSQQPWLRLGDATEITLHADGTVTLYTDVRVLADGTRIHLAQRCASLAAALAVVRARRLSRAPVVRCVLSAALDVARAP